MTRLEEIRELAQNARPMYESDYASYRQIQAENKLYDAVENIIDMEQFETYALKASVNERISYILRKVTALWTGAG